MTVDQRGPLPPLAADAYMLLHDGELGYRNVRLVRGDRAWHYVGATHEYITTRRKHCERSMAHDIVHWPTAAPGRKVRARPRLLEAQLAEQPDDPRTVFYLAQTLRDLGRARPSARRLFQRRTEMGGWDEEVYCAASRPACCAPAGPGAGRARSRPGSGGPQRLEASRLAAGACAGASATTPPLASPRSRGRRAARPADDLLVHPWVYRWGLLFEYSIAAYWVGDVRRSLAACDAPAGAATTSRPRTAPDPAQPRVRRQGEGSGDRRYCPSYVTLPLSSV